ncbi:ATP phosphoribosyltransferase regulatory subunit [uncultured Robinsoniella sp.]|uniref:ATP phosphoribosyltransferase regulatory subunit n=1 Tax=uncultured Robinsoniella sp. TaxID=904190 RepID=UPI00374EFCC1
MNQRLLHTPEGVRDIYNAECEKKLTLQDKLHKVLKSYGYRDIETPTFEYFDVFGQDVGTIPSKDLYKFFDREGNTLVLRPDFTPSIARAAAKYFTEEDLSIRLCYMGNTFINNSSYQGRLKETTQLGAEFIGDDSVDADAEIVTLVIETLRSAGLKDFQISIGHVEFFKSLMTEAGIDEETEEELRELISNKNMFGVEELLSEKNISEELKNVFATLPQLFGTVDALERAKLLTSNPGALKAIARLEELYGILKYYGVEKYVSFDLGMISKYMYYTGIIFRGYTFGTGDAIVKGGRYDNMMGRFGKDAPSIGFVVVVDQLLTALSRQKIDVPAEQVNRLILYKKEQRKEAITLAKHLRIENNYVELICQKESLDLEDYLIFARRSRINEILYFEEKDRILSVNTETKVVKPAGLMALLS